MYLFIKTHDNKSISNVKNSKREDAYLPNSAESLDINHKFYTPCAYDVHKTVRTTIMTLKQHCFKTVSKLFWNCFVSVSFNCAERLIIGLKTRTQTAPGVS